MNPSQKSHSELQREVDALRRRIAELEGIIQEDTGTSPVSDLLICRRIVSFLEDAVCMVDTNYIYQEANESYLRLCGKDKDSLVGRHVCEVMGQQAFDTVLKPRLQRALTGETVRFATWLDFPIAGRRYLNAVYAPCHDNDGRIIGVVVTTRDATQRQQAVDSLEASQIDLEETHARLTLAMDMARLVSWEMDVATRTFTFDDQFYDLYGTTAEREGGPRMSAEAYAKEFVHPEEAWMVANEIDKSLASKRNDGIRRLEHRIIRRDGQTRHIAVCYKVLRDQAGRPTKTIGANQDITERKLMEEALLESEARLQMTLDATTDGIWSWNFETNELAFSPRYYRMLGYEPDQFAPTFENWKKLIHPDDLEAALATAQEYLQTKQDSYENQFRMRTMDGEYRWLHATARVVERDEHGEAVLLIGNHQDITDQKRLENEKEKQAKSLEDMNSALRVILEQRTREQNALQEQTAHNIVHLIEPYLARIVAAARNPVIDQYVETILENLFDSAAPLTKILSVKYSSLTSNEIRIANLIRQGKSSKDIADVTNVSLHTVDYYRRSIRRKLGVRGRKSNLRTLLDMIANDQPL